MRKFLWHGGGDTGIAKVAWAEVCKPIEEGGQGIRSLEQLNKALLSRHFWAVVQRDTTSIWVLWITTYRLKKVIVWMAGAHTSSWSWHKILRLRNQFLGHVVYQIGSGESFSLWQDPWHRLGVLNHRFPRGPQATGILLDAKLADVLCNGEWTWPEILDIEHREITHQLPPMIGTDCILWDSHNGMFINIDAYKLFQPTGLKVPWAPLFMGPFKIPRNCFILWLEILGRLSTLDRSWWLGPDRSCVLCNRNELESHNHLFFECEFSKECRRLLRLEV
ncbi:UNVERIFIED_CONTAM: putative ribonuclease H protein [Sesamum latifolium]|uniref:Ribonuclease H protein n=1 Tax=Sesamum latifolium TaxID=2727402 RepID=A0AAW2VVV0_9LAMI